VPTTDCISQVAFKFQGYTLPISVKADAPRLSSDGGVLALRKLDEGLSVTAPLAEIMHDCRDARQVRHTRLEQLRQRIYQIALGYEDCNDADSLRGDLVWQTACSEREPAPLSSQPSLSRFENEVSGAELRAMWCELERQYVDGLSPTAPMVLLDIDSTDDPTHGQQELAFFHGFYDQHMFHPLLMFDGESGQLITAVLRPGRAHASWAADGMLRRVIRAIRRRCPNAAIVVRGDSGFAMPWLLDTLDGLNKEIGEVHYVIGIAKNPRLLALAATTIATAAAQHRASEEHVRKFAWLNYAAASWSRSRAIVLKAEHGTRGANPRFVVTNMTWVAPRSIYDGAYCPRGQSENFIKDFKNALRADRLSCHRFLANAFRLLLHAVAYRLMHALRAGLGAFDPRIGRLQMDTLRLAFLKVGALVTRSARRLLVQLPRAFPGRHLLLRFLS